MPHTALRIVINRETVGRLSSYRTWRPQRQALSRDHGGKLNIAEKWRRFVLAIGCLAGNTKNVAIDDRFRRGLLQQVALAVQRG